MKRLKDRAIIGLTSDWVDFRYIETLCEFILEKIVSSKIVIRRDNYFLQFARVTKYLFAQLDTSNRANRQQIHLSLPYHVRDVAKMPREVESVSTLKIGIADIFKMVVLYLLLVLFAERKSKCHRAYVLGVITVAMTYYKGVQKSGADTVHFHGYAFVPDVAAFVHILANDKTLSSHFHEYMSFVDDSVHIVTNCLHSTNELSGRYAKHFYAHYHADEYVYERSFDDLIAIFGDKPASKRRVGVYSSGFYCRADHGFFEDEIINAGVIREREMLSQVYDYAIKRPDIEFIIFPHYTRDVEPFEKAVVHYRDILRLNNVSLADANKESMDEHANIELGLTTISNVFWDRLFMGFKTILINPIFIETFVNNTGVKNVSVATDRVSFDEQVDRFLEMSGVEYIRLLAQTTRSDSAYFEASPKSG